MTESLRKIHGNVLKHAFLQWFPRKVIPLTCFLFGLFFTMLNVKSPHEFAYILNNKNVSFCVSFSFNMPYMWNIPRMYPCYKIKWT